MLWFLLRVDLNNLPCNIDGKTRRLRRRRGRMEGRPGGQLDGIFVGTLRSMGSQKTQWFGDPRVPCVIQI